MLVVSTKMHVYEVRPRKDKRGVDLISDALPFGHLWYLEVAAAIGYAKFYSRSHDAVINVYDAADQTDRSTQNVQSVCRFHSKLKRSVSGWPRVCRPALGSVDLSVKDPIPDQV